MNKRLYRSTSDRKLAGVCGGIGEFFGIDPTIIRVIYVIGTVFPGFFLGGLAIYIVLAIVIPFDPGYTDI
ncbi:MAG: PspC domain-containing protein [Clostridiales bacterium]|nr:PspC domain-containing protein [Clostridiales bacterium]